MSMKIQASISSRNFVKPKTFRLAANKVTLNDRDLSRADWRLVFVSDWPGARYASRAFRSLGAS